jgi:hypothetical protein
MPARFARHRTKNATIASAVAIALCFAAGANGGLARQHQSLRGYDRDGETQLERRRTRLPRRAMIAAAAMRAGLVSLAGLTAALVCMPAAAVTFHVQPDGSGDVATIQDAIDAAAPGDEIVLGMGTFLGPRNRDLTFQGKNLTLRSQGGDPAACIIDAAGQTRGLSITQGETAVLVQGITIRNGFGAWGGGVNLMNSTSAFRNCVITACRADDSTAPPSPREPTPSMPRSHSKTAPSRATTSRCVARAPGCSPGNRRASPRRAAYSPATAPRKRPPAAAAAGFASRIRG